MVSVCQFSGTFVQVLLYIADTYVNMIRSRANPTIFATTFLFLSTCQGVFGNDLYNDYNPPSMGLIIGLSLGAMVLMMGLSAICFYCPLCCLYKMRGSRGVVTYTSPRPVPGGTVAAVTPQYPYPSGVVMHPQGGAYPPGTAGGPIISQGTVYVQGTPYYQGGIIYSQGPQGPQRLQGPQGPQMPYPQGTLIIPQSAPNGQAQPLPYTTNMQ